MTKLLVLSDSHGDILSLNRIVEVEKPVGGVFYLGDGLSDFYEVLESNDEITTFTVAGNNDFYAFEPLEALAVFEKVIIFYTHGHKQQVKYNLDNLERDAKNHNADIALFGHTHKRYNQEKDGVLYFNPGTCGRNYLDETSYGVITLDKGKIISVEHKKITI